MEKERKEKADQSEKARKEMKYMLVDGKVKAFEMVEKRKVRIDTLPQSIKDELVYG